MLKPVFQSLILNSKFSRTLTVKMSTAKKGKKHVAVEYEEDNGASSSKGEKI
jgi:hypothetical protein